MTRHAKRHLKWLLGLGTLGLVATGATNVAVNPWRVLPQKTEVKSLDPYREIDAEIRTCKAGLAMRGPWDVLVIGSSRPNTGIDPSLPVFGGKAINLGMPGGDLFETRAMLDHALKYQAPKRALLFLDAGDLTRPGKMPIESDFEFSPLAQSDPLERDLKYVFSQRAMDSSVVTLTFAAKHQAPHYTPLGLHLKKPPRLDYFETMEKFYLPWAVVLADVQKRNLGIQQDKLTVVRAMLDACAKDGVDAILAIPPNHLTLCQAMEERGAPDPYFLAERRAIAALVAEANQAHPEHPCQLWDLNIPSPATLEPFPADRKTPMENWLDPIHFTPAAGGRYAGLMLGTAQEDPTLGIHVDPSQPEPYLTKVEQLFKAAATALPAEREGLRKALAADSQPKVQPKK
ncbi:hypothetical protein [Luteolibacter sp. LG18]|uniref:hypothetical protein n=1 Tax=Luteolibacter sp. LG18 TaxID=2819286 RepID=UPI002B280BD0|nr:hypothetical protein llg_18130 [Luteolibacter sp. LG18]